MASLQRNTSPSRDPPGLRYPTNGKTIYHRPLNRTRPADLSRASFAYLILAMVTHAQRQARDISDLEQQLTAYGHRLGLKLLDLLLFREPPRTQSRALTIVALLLFVKQQVWTQLFGRQADSLEKSTKANYNDEYMIVDNDPLVNQYVSVPRDMSSLNCAAYVAGIIEGVCDAAAFPARVTAYNAGKTGEDGEMWPSKTVFVIKFEPEVVEREGFLGSKN